MFLNPFLLSERFIRARMIDSKYGNPFCSLELGKLWCLSQRRASALSVAWQEKLDIMGMVHI